MLNWNNSAFLSSHRRFAIVLAMLALTLTAAPPAAWSQLFTDSFDGASGSRPANWQVTNALENQHWFMRDGMLISGDSQNLPQRAPTYAWLNASNASDLANYQVNVDVWMPGVNGQVMVLGHWRDAQSHYAAVLESDGRGNRSARLERVQRGARTVLQTKTSGLPAFERTSPPASRPTRLGLAVRGNSLQLLLNGQVAVEAENSLPMRPGSVGLGLGNGLILFDNFEVAQVAATRTGTAPGALFPATAVATPRPLMLTPAAPAGNPDDTGFRVRVDRHANAQEAGETRRRLEELGYWNISVERDGNDFAVFMETKTRRHADEMVITLRDEGFTRAEAVATGVATIGLDPSLAGLLGGRALTPGDIQNLAARDDGAIREQIQRILREETLDQETRSRVTMLSSELEALRAELERSRANDTSRAANMQRMTRLTQQANTFLNNNNITGAQGILREMIEIDPTHSTIATLEARIRSFEDARTRDEEDRKRLATLVEQAERAEIEGNFNHALQLWMSVATFRPTILTPEIEQKRTDSQRRIENKRREMAQRQQEEVSVVKQGLYIVGGIVAAIAIFLVFYVMTAKRRVKKVMEEALPQMVLPEMMDFAAGGHMAIDAPKAAPLGLPDASSAPTTGAAALSGASSTGSSTRRGSSAVRRPRPGAPGASPAAPAPPHPNAPTRAAAPVPPAQASPAAATAPDKFDPTAMAPPASAETDAGLGAKSAMERKSSITAPALDLGIPDLPDFGGIGNLNVGASPSDSNLGVEKDRLSDSLGTANPEESFSTLLKGLPSDDTLGTPKAAAPPARPEKAEKKPAPAAANPMAVDLGDLGLGESFSLPAAGAATASKQASAKPKAEARAQAEVGEVFRQDFADLAPGATPSNWDGSFTFADLQVVDSTSLGNGSNVPAPPRAIRYEKKSASGQVYYACSFPDVRGVAEVEFDLCCLEKNRYLLGIYIEKNRDFRHSIHTVIHCASPQSKAMIRLQGTPTNYVMGAWAHVKFRLDLGTKKMMAEVDGKTVIEDEFIENMPDIINTLAIRDNHPTTGTLLLSNVVVRKTA